ncbi:MFS peptide transporter [Ascodesmis nigricans]|uniref:MFS peptide transporter n=1 Tax=Ascodesmis nigricans TaxID=341454 RepID=A0A4S2N8Q8_9PEZI|nr:MFS peptide transporter [Ascodesmis nigricans]
MKRLRHVAGRLPWLIYPVAFVEMCERMSYCGTIAVFVNYIQRPLPPGSITGAGHDSGHHSGALGMGQRASTAITTFDTFWSYTLPLLGGWVADTKWGRYKTIQMAALAAIIGHVCLIMSALPPLLVLNNKGSLALLLIGIIIIGFATGGFKANISPLMAEQFSKEKPRIKVLKSGELVIVDHDLTVTRLYGYFYMFLNVGAIVGQTAMIYAEKYVGFYLAYIIPTGMYLTCPLVMFWCRNRYAKAPPSGNVLVQAYQMWKLAMKGRWSWNLIKMLKGMSSEDFWEHAKPSNIPEERRPKWMMGLDDKWVDELARGLRACKIFLWYPIYWLSYNQMNNNLVSQAATMNTHGIPNDFISNVNPISLIIFIPLFEHLIFPYLRKRFHLTIPPLHRITVGYITASLALVFSAVIQHYIYLLSPCGKNANKCPTPTDITVWWQIGPYAMIGLSEMLAITSGMEYAYKQAPETMKSLVMAVFLFMAALACLLAQAFVPLAEDPLLEWNYAVPAVLLAIAAVGFWWTSRGMGGGEEEEEGSGDGLEMRDEGKSEVKAQ